MAKPNNAAFLDALLQPVEVPADPLAEIDNDLGEEASEIAEAFGQVARLRRELEISRHGVRLAAPGCGEGCRECYRKCAVARIQLGWWERELRSLTGGLA